MDLFGFQPPALTAPVRRYFSGVAAPAIWAGYADAGVPMCLVVAKLPAEGITRARAFVASGGDLLLDSGAFIHRERPSALDWPAILATYRDIAEAGPVTVVLPDVVGDQDGTLQLLVDQALTLRALAAHPNVTTLLPLQGGTRALSTLHAQAVQRLGFLPDGIALPSHAAALPPASLRDLAAIPHQPRRLHFLGVSRNATKLGDRLLRLAEVWPDARVSADACEHRAQVGQGQPITQRRAAVLTELLDDARSTFDDTEDDDATDHALAALAAQFPDLGKDELSDLLCSSWGLHLCHNYRQQKHAKALGPVATRASIREFATAQRAARPQPAPPSDRPSQIEPLANTGITAAEPDTPARTATPFQIHRHENDPQLRRRRTPLRPAARHPVPAAKQLGFALCRPGDGPRELPLG